MTQPTERRFVMEPRLDAEIQTINDALDTKITHGAVVNSDVAVGAAIDKTKIAGTAVTQADTGTVTSTMIANGTIVDADVSGTAAIAPAKIAGTAVTQADTGTVTGTMIADNTITSVDLATLDYIKFNTAYSGGSTQPGMLNWNDTDGTLEFQLKGGNVTLQVGQEQVVRVKNDTGAALSNGKAVYISGSNGVNLLASYANAGAENTSSQTIGITTEEIGSNQHGFVTTFGLVRNIDTSTLIEGAAVWLGTTNGGLTATRPAAPNHGVLIGFCLRKHATVGVIFVRVDNGWELDELHNVSITSPTNGQGLTYDAATQMWKNATPISALSGLSDVTITSPVSGEKLVYNGTKWVNLASAGSAFTVSDVAPSLTTASEGDAWVNSSNGTMAVCYVDPDGTKLWLQVQANSALEASIIARLGQLESSAIALGTYSPNYIINGAFDINQRGLTTLTNTNAYGYDRWIYYCSGGTCTYEAKTFTPGELAIGTINPTNYARLTSTGQTATNSILQFQHKIEDVRTLAGKTATFSFYAKVASGTPSVTIELGQNFGTGGSTTVWTPQKIVLTGGSSWTRYSVTFNVPSISGKTIGSGNCMEITYFLSAGSNHNARSLSLGIQSNTFDIACVQLEAGSTATSFRRNAPSIQAELAACQRYYWVIAKGGVDGPIGTAGYYAANQATTIISFPVTMRVAPSLELTTGTDYYNMVRTGSSDGLNSLGIGAVTASSVYLYNNTEASGTSGGYSLLLVGNANAYLAMKAEL